MKNNIEENHEEIWSFWFKFWMRLQAWQLQRISSITSLGTEYWEVNLKPQFYLHNWPQDTANMESSWHIAIGSAVTVALEWYNLHPVAAPSYGTCHPRDVHQQSRHCKNKKCCIILQQLGQASLARPSNSVEFVECLVLTETCLSPLSQTYLLEGGGMCVSFVESWKWENSMWRV